VTFENRGAENTSASSRELGKTAAYLTNYEIQFAAKLADVQEEKGRVYEPCMRQAASSMIELRRITDQGDRPY